MTIWPEVITFGLIVAVLMLLYFNIMDDKDE